MPDAPNVKVNQRIDVHVGNRIYTSVVYFVSTKMPGDCGVIYMERKNKPVKRRVSWDGERWKSMPQDHGTYIKPGDARYSDFIMRITPPYLDED